jgi:hypothetical protein
MSKPITEAGAYRMREELRRLNKVVERKSRQVRRLRERLREALADRDRAEEMLQQLPPSRLGRSEGPIRLSEADYELSPLGGYAL